MARFASGSRAVLVVGAALIVAVTAAAGQDRPTGASPAERRAVEQATRLRDAGRTAEAARALREFLTRDPTSPVARRMLIHLHIEAGFVDSARAESRRWVRGSPDEASAHLALADVELADADTSSALRILEGVRGAVQDPRVVLERLADIYIVSGRRDEVLRTWETLLAMGEPGIGAVVEDARSGGRPRAFAEQLWDALRSGAPGESMRNGAYAALRLGSPGAARALARASEPAVAADRSRHLRTYLGEATGAGLPGEVAWAAAELAGSTTRPADRQRWQAVSADMALVVGDTSAARETFRTLLAESRPGDAAHRLASRRLFSVLASSPGDLSEAEALWDSHRRAYPDSALEVARMAAELAEGRARALALQEAERGLTDARVSLGSVGARAILDAAGARLALYRGEPDTAFARLVRATEEPGPNAVAHTRNLRMLGVIEGASALELEVLGETLLQLLRSPAAWEAETALERFAALPPSAARPALLALLAEELDSAGRPDPSATVLRRLIDEFPGSPEAPDALLQLARRELETRPDSARVWLERLITGYPGSALAPLARRLLAELDPAAPSGGDGSG